MVLVFQRCRQILSVRTALYLILSLLWLVLIQGSYNIPDTKFKAFSMPFQGLNIFFKAKHNWKKVDLLRNARRSKHTFICFSLVSYFTALLPKFDRSKDLADSTNASMAVTLSLTFTGTSQL